MQTEARAARLELATSRDCHGHAQLVALLAVIDDPHSTTERWAAVEMLHSIAVDRDDDDYIRYEAIRILLELPS